MEAVRPAGEWPGLRGLIGILVGFGGVVLLFGSSADDARALNPYGAAAVVFASLSWAAGSLYGRGATLPASPLLGTGMEMLSGGAVLLLLAWALGEWGFDLTAALAARHLPRSI
jgi:drug/metabolite transporter (DMT)-like permease